MKFTELDIHGAYLIEQERCSDERGFFARQFCHRQMANHGIDFDIRQCNVSYNRKAGTLRGLHYQKEPFPEIKLVSCFQGVIFDVLVDLRSDSRTYLKWISTELSAENGRSVFVPPGVAHGFQTLCDNVVVYYQLGEFFKSECYAGVRWNDPKLGIAWPDCDVRIINERDASYELL